MLAIEEDMAEVIVLGCAGMCEMVDTMKEKLTYMYLKKQQQLYHH